MESVEHFPPPWKLKGEGFIFPFWGKKDYLLERGFLTEEDKEHFRGGLGAMMLVNYEKSDVGPYFELLFIPGNFEFRGRTYKRITKIYVSTEISVREGIRNWAIPKEVAHFDWEKEGSLTTIRAITKGHPLFSARISSLPIPFPIATALMPMALMQRAPENYLETAFSGYGLGRPAIAKGIEANDSFFPDPLKSGSSKYGIYVKPFHLTFPVAKRHS